MLNYDYDPLTAMPLPPATAPVVTPETQRAQPYPGDLVLVGLDLLVVESSAGGLISRFVSTPLMRKPNAPVVASYCIATCDHWPTLKLACERTS